MEHSEDSTQWKEKKIPETMEKKTFRNNKMKEKQITH